MKKISSNVFAIAIFILLLCYSMDFEIGALISIKLMGLMAFGIGILFIPHLLEGIKKEEIPELIGMNARTVGYIGTLIILFFGLQSIKGTENLLSEAALACRPVLYGFIIYEVCGKRKKKAAEPPEQEEMQETLKDRLKGAGLTSREVQIALLINAGLTNKEIAEELFIAETTVKKHVSNIFDKLGVEKRSQVK